MNENLLQSEILCFDAFGSEASEELERLGARFEKEASEISAICAQCLEMRDWAELRDAVAECEADETEPVPEAGKRLVEDQFSAIQNSDVRREFLDVLEIVRRQKHRGPFTPRRFLQGLEKLPKHDRIQSKGRIVQHQQL